MYSFHTFALKTKNDSVYQYFADILLNDAESLVDEWVADELKSKFFFYCSVSATHLLFVAVIINVMLLLYILDRVLSKDNSVNHASLLEICIFYR